MSAIVNSQNVTFAVGGGNGANISADFITGQGAQDTVPCKSLHYVNTPQAGPNGLVFEDMDGNQVSAQVIPSGLERGYVCTNGGSNSVFVKTAVSTANETASSGCYWLGSDNSKSFIYLNDLDHQGDPMPLYIPASVVADIVYECCPISYMATAENILFGLKETSGQDEADFIASSYINFPASGFGNAGEGHQCCMLRVYNSQNTGFTVYPAFWKGYKNKGNDGYDYRIDYDKFTMRYF